MKSAFLQSLKNDMYVTTLGRTKECGGIAQTNDKAIRTESEGATIYMTISYIDPERDLHGQVMAMKGGKIEQYTVPMPIRAVQEIFGCQN